MLGLVACLSNGVKVGGTTKLVLSAPVNDVPVSSLTVGSSSLAVGVLGLFFEAEPASFFGERANVWEGE